MTPVVEIVGQGEGVAVLFNARAKQVTAEAVRAMRRALPKALVLVSEDFAQARRHAKAITDAKPWLFVPAGGDGSVVRGLNLLREAAPHKPFPALGILKMGTGNAWANIAGASDYYTAVKRLPTLRKPLPTTRFELVEVENTLCPFAGVGWDAQLVNAYYRNLDARSSQLLGSALASKLHKGMYGYLHSLFTIMIPEEIVAQQRYGAAQVLVENLGDEAYTIDARGELERWLPRGDASPQKLYEGPVRVAGASTSPELGFHFKAFPFARKKPGWLNVRVYEAATLEATRRMLDLWTGKHPLPGMHDWFVQGVRMRFSRPMPFQIGGDGLGERDELVLRLAPESVDLVDWGAALPGDEFLAPTPPPERPSRFRRARKA